MSIAPKPPHEDSGAADFGSLCGDSEAGWNGQEMNPERGEASAAAEPSGSEGDSPPAATNDACAHGDSGAANTERQGESAPAPDNSPVRAGTTAPATAAPAAKDSPPETKAMTLMDHLNELRVRLVRSAIAITLAFMACYSWSEEIFGQLMRPLIKALPPNSKLIFTALPEAFFVYMQVGLVAALFLASPYLFYQIWGFIAPGLYDEEKKHAIPLALFSAFFFLLGAVFCYLVVFPFSFTFFMGFATDDIIPMPSLSEYLGFALKMLIAFGLIFEMPLFTFFLSRMGIVTAAAMRRVRRYAILAIFIVAAILTPPDVMSQMLMAIPMLLLYELSIFIAVAFGKKPKAEQEKPEEHSEPAT
ncbi:MAG: twin-arginine translocase subunit TatC [Desulfovibrionaceae bacterium]